MEWFLLFLGGGAYIGLFICFGLMITVVFRITEKQALTPKKSPLKEKSPQEKRFDRWMTLGVGFVITFPLWFAFLVLLAIKILHSGS